MFRSEFVPSLMSRVCPASAALEKALNEELSPYGISCRQWPVLGWLMRQGPLSQAEPAGRLRIEPPTLVGVVDRMGRAGRPERSSCPGDRRREPPRPTGRVGPARERIASAARRAHGRASEGLSEAGPRLLVADPRRLRAEPARTETAPAAAIAAMADPMPGPSPALAPATPVHAEELQR